MAKVKAIPDNYPRVTAYLTIDGASDAIEFYKKIFGAEERFRMPQPDGTIGHAELQIGDSVIMMSDAFPDMGIIDPKKLGGTPITLTVYVEDVDATFAEAVKAGAKTRQPVENKFYGDRSGQFEDPWGHRWNVMSHVEDVAPDEMAKRAAAFAAGNG
jgi:PhnB protein